MAEHVLPDLIEPGLKIVFCGTAAGNVSAARGAYYAHPQNRFWSALHAFGLTPRKLKPEEYPELPQWGLGLTDIAKHVSGLDRELPPDALRPGGLRGARGEDYRRRAGLARLHEPRGRAPLSRPRRQLRRATRADRPNPPLAPPLAIAQRRMELAEQHALVARARRRGAGRGAGRLGLSQAPRASMYGPEISLRDLLVDRT